MRRFAPASVKAAGRSISEYNFGHPSLDRAFDMRLAGAAYVAPKNHGVKVSELNNGVRVITHNREGPQVSVGAYIAAGAKYDPATAPGLSYVMRWALMGSNFENSIFQMDRTLRAVGCSQSHTEIRKRLIGFRIEGRADMWHKPVEDMFTCISAPRFPEYDTERFRDTMDNILQERRWKTPRDYAVDELEGLAFYRETLGKPRFVPEISNDDCSQSQLINHWARLCIPSRIIIAGVNVDHSDLVAAYENGPFPHSVSAPHHARAQSEWAEIDQSSEAAQFAPGTERVDQERRYYNMGDNPWMENEAIAAVGFRTYGRDDNINRYATSLVLQQCFDISIGDAIRVDRGPADKGVRSFLRNFSTAGLVGFTLRTKGADAGKELASATQSFKGLNVTDEVLQGAIERAICRFYHDELEYARDYVDFLGGSLATKGTAFVSAEDAIEAIRKVTKSSVQEAHKYAVGAAPVLFAHGDTVQVPSLRQLGLK